MKLKTLLLVVLATLALSLSAETAYQKKAYQIYEKYYTLFKDGYSHGLNMTESMMFSMDPEAMTAMAAMSALEWFPMNKLNYFIEQMERELEQAESLMTPEERKKKAEQDAIKARQKTSVGYLEMAIQANLMQWAVKGEFEKTTDFQKRLQEEGKTRFATVCKEYFPKATFDVKPLRYDADKEKYDFEIKYTLQFTGKSFTHDVTVAIPIDVDAARYLSQNTPKIPIVDCVWGMNENNITPQSYKITINGKTYTATTKASDLIVKGVEIVPNIVELKSLSYNYSDLRRQRIQNKAQLIVEIEQYNNRMTEQDAITQYKIQSSPYYSKLPEYKKQDFIHSSELKQFTIIDDIDVIEEYYNQITKKEEISAEVSLQPVKEYLRHNDPKKYVEAYFEEQPDSATFLQQEWIEYQCRYEYQNIDQFVIAYLEGKLDTSKRDCREKAWNKYSKYYDNKDAFDDDFSKGKEEFQNKMLLYAGLEDKIEEIKRYLNTNIENSADKIPVAGLFTSATKKVSTLNLQGGNESNNKYVQAIARVYNQLSPYPNFQEKAANIIITESEKTQKEYDKNGSLFSSKAEFVTAYFNSEYKKILKSKK